MSSYLVLTRNRQKEIIMGAEIIYMITTDELKERGFIHGNVEDTVLAVLIERTQRLKMRPILGGVLYKKILADIKAYNNGVAPSTPIPADYKTLMEDYILPCLIPMIEKRATVHLNYKMRNKAIGSGNDEFIRANNRQETADLQDDLEDDIADMRNELIRYLKDNTDNFPEYLECNNVDLTPEEEADSTSGSIDFIYGGNGNNNNCKNRRYS